MKWFLLLFLTFFYGTIMAQKLVSLENQWHMLISGVGFNAYLFKDSTLINGKYYFKLYWTQDSSLKTINPTRYYLREQEGKVFRITENTSDDTEKLIYNFNFKIGDSISYSFGSKIKVYKIDTVELKNGEKRKRWTFSSPRFSNPLDQYYLRYCIEGIGFVGAPCVFFIPEQIYITTGGGNLECFFQKNTYLYGRGTSCAVKLGPTNSTKSLPTIPSIELLKHTPDGQVLYNLQEPGRYRYQLYNSQGALLASGIASQGNNELSLAFWPRGMYVLQILDEEHWRQKTYKLIRQ
jgi:hypothetical protein